ncbi:MAG: hypothetical protein ACRDCI_17455 [Plesiomonas shigelloides]
MLSQISSAFTAENWRTSASLFVFPVLLTLVAPVHAEIASTTPKGLSVALSDNVLVLNDTDRSASLELVNLGSLPTEFALQSVKMVMNAKTQDGSEFIRWAPQRAKVPANQTMPMRISARQLDKLPPGEYMLKLNVSALTRPGPEAKTADKAQGVAVTIPIMPVLPVTVYLRHGIDTPGIRAQKLVYTPKDREYLGYFPVTKTVPGQSFVGQIQVVNQATGDVLSSGRLHLRPTTNESVVRMPRGKFTAVLGFGIHHQLDRLQCELGR